MNNDELFLVAINRDTKRIQVVDFRSGDPFRDKSQLEDYFSDVLPQPTELETRVRRLEAEITKLRKIVAEVFNEGYKAGQKSRKQKL